MTDTTLDLRSDKAAWEDWSDGYGEGHNTGCECIYAALRSDRMDMGWAAMEAVWLDRITSPPAVVADSVHPAVIERDRALAERDEAIDAAAAAVAVARAEVRETIDAARESIDDWRHRLEQLVTDPKAKALLALYLIRYERRLGDAPSL